ncbi:hypothetical protein T492DRAFT_905403, partial [Pavlovales sp. CCMP2436]
MASMVPSCVVSGMALRLDSGTVQALPEPPWSRCARCAALGLARSGKRVLNLYSTGRETKKRPVVFRAGLSKRVKADVAPESFVGHKSALSEVADAIDEPAAEAAKAVEVEAVLEIEGVAVAAEEAAVVEADGEGEEVAAVAAEGAAASAPRCSSVPPRPASVDMCTQAPTPGTILPPAEALAGESEQPRAPAFDAANDMADAELEPVAEMEVEAELEAGAGGDAVLEAEEGEVVDVEEAEPEAKEEVEEEAGAVGDDDSDDGEFGAGLLEDPPADSDAHFSESGKQVLPRHGIHMLCKASEEADCADEDDAPAKSPTPTLTAEGARPPARMSVDEAEANKQAKQQRAGRKRRRHADASCIHPSLADLEAREAEESQRRKMKMLEFWRNERVVYRRRQSLRPSWFKSTVTGQAHRRRALPLP